MASGTVTFHFDSAPEENHFTQSFPSTNNVVVKNGKDHGDSAGPVDEDERQLKQLGYSQTFNRILGAFENFSVSFATVGFVSGVSALYAFAIPNGGPQAMFANWVVISVMATLSSMVMAEICSSMPTAGGHRWLCSFH